MTGLSRFNLEDCTVAITGGTSRYGRQMVTDVAAAGATVVATSRELSAAEKIAEEEQEKAHDVRAQQLDLGDHESILEFCETITDDYDDLHGLVNNAIARPMEHLYADIEDWRESMECNATGTLEITRRVARHLAETRGGSIINIGSIHGMVGPTPHLYEGTDLFRVRIRIFSVSLLS